MDKRESVAGVIDLETGERAPRDPEAATEALEAITFTEQPPTDAPPPLQAEAPQAPKPKRRTKAELEADVQRLSGEIERQRQVAAANAPSLAQSMVNPLAMTFRSVGNIMAAWRGDHWRLDDKEVLTLGEAWAPCIAPLLANHPETILWAAAIGATYSVAYPRLQMEKTLAARAKVATDTTATPQAEVMVTQ
jgi:hypothetical protein